ncbi:protein trichome birefringence-like 38 [Salvia miltiorrhiza]|uniref:protein trichome birefringence-like 38 n=1 Tax=Salvia miltiorrhiza TaxID=226208 RepID=UPI0025ABE800|nr:protein trichome birefringence-like 38 [Salvia miltiorrhiza]
MMIMNIGKLKNSVLIKIVVCMCMVSSCVSTSNDSFVGQKQIEKCNIYEGKWVYDESYPLFDSSKCSAIRGEFNCLKRPDRQFLNYRWQPSACNLPKFDAGDFLRRMKGKKIVFVGDSVSQNHGQSLICLLNQAGAPSQIIHTVNNSTVINNVKFEAHDVSITIFLSHYLVDIVNEKIGRVLKLDSIKDGETWKQADVLIFNTWLWWYRSGPKQPWDYIESEGKIVKDMDRMEAFRRGLTTWKNWADANLSPSKTKVFFQGISPSHYKGEDWNEKGVSDCSRETTPVEGSTYPAGEPLALKVLKSVLERKTSSPSMPVGLLDITTLSQLRKDGHPSKYNLLGGMDCTHWCLAGVPDTWNLLLYTELLRSPH